MKDEAISCNSAFGHLVLTLLSFNHHGWFKLFVIQSKQRCSATGLADRCLKYCGICCAECNCVPSGTYGNKHECPCYRDKKNSKASLNALEFI
ncbi:hypothetical protein HAX54_048549 [Datura stramonium]|uniref:Snakin-1 n=1 Tax=Datura stramonium TaxID=4076 RepID=A0ABS8SUL1_DATST|nr:hypothetical protein [Datura stramonium]